MSNVVRINHGAFNKGVDEVLLMKPIRRVITVFSTSTSKAATRAGSGKGVPLAPVKNRKTRVEPSRK